MGVIILYFLPHCKLKKIVIFTTNYVFGKPTSGFLHQREALT